MTTDTKKPKELQQKGRDNEWNNGINMHEISDEIENDLDGSKLAMRKPLSII